MAKKYPFPSIHLYLLLALLSLTTILLTLTLGTRRQNVQAADIMSKGEVVKKNCNTTGSPVINVAQKVTNSVDSGQAGNYWAFDSYNRTIQVWKQSDGTYCALVAYEGKFDAQKGQRSPGNTGMLTGSEDGTFKGGYRAVIAGALLRDPSLPTKGSIGTVDYRCTLSGSCPGAFDWTTKYFNTATTGFTFNYSWWGWQYHAKGQAICVNSSDGNSGDIL